MTKDEIKENVNMTDVLKEYDIEVKRGMCRCPFHSDHKPSMKVHKDGVTCFTCGKTWDQFGFVMEMESCDFKTAFRKLGGSYEHESWRQRIINKANREAGKAKRERTRMVNRELYDTVSLALMICHLADQVYEPLSDEWCYLKNELPKIEYIFEQRFIYGDEVQEIGDIDVDRKCRQIISRFLPDKADIRGTPVHRVGLGQTGGSYFLKVESKETGNSSGI